MKNEYEIQGDSVAIFLTRRDGTKLTTFVDLDGFDKVSKYPSTWFSHYNQCTKTFYVQTHIKLDGEWVTLHMHRIIANTPDGYVADHIDGDTLNNRSSNLRNLTHAQNQQNTRSKVTKLGSRGVFWNKRMQAWQANLRYDGRTIHLGTFETELDAENAVKSARAQLMPHSLEALGVGMENVPHFPINLRSDGFGPCSKNKSGERGVSWKSNRKRWRVQFHINGKAKEFGYFSNLDDAIACARTVKENIGLRI